MIANKRQQCEKNDLMIPSSNIYLAILYGILIFLYSKHQVTPNMAEQGISASKIATEIGVSRPTVIKYLKKVAESKVVI